MRQPGPEGWPVWREVRLQALAEAPTAFSSSLVHWQGPGDTEQSWRDRLRDVAGQVSCATPDDRGEAELISMWVAPDVRGTGLGDSMVRQVVRWAREQGAHGVKLAVMDGNTPAIALYQRHGFVFTNEPAADGQHAMALSLSSPPGVP